MIIAPSSGHSKPEMQCPLCRIGASDGHWQPSLHSDTQDGKGSVQVAGHLSAHSVYTVPFTQSEKCQSVNSVISNGNSEIPFLEVDDKIDELFDDILTKLVWVNHRSSNVTHYLIIFKQSQRN